MNQFPNIPQRIAAEIIEKIMKNDIKLGDRLYEEEFRKQFNVSQTVIREMFLILVAKDLVTKIPRKGVFVNAPEKDQLDKLFETRELIDSFVAKKTAICHTAEDVAELQKYLDDSEIAYKEKNYMLHSEIAAKFHSKIYDCSGYIKLKKVYENIQELVDIYYYNSHYNKSIFLEKDLKDHRQILKAINSGDPDSSMRLAGQHVMNVKKRLERI